MNRATWHFYILLGVNLLTWSLVSLLGPMTPELTIALSLPSEAYVGMVQAVFLIVSGVISFLWAALENRHSRKHLLILATTFWTIGTFATGFARSFGVLFIFQLVAAIGYAAVLPLVNSLIMDLIPKARRGRAFGLLAMTNIVGMGLGIVISGVLIAFFPWYVPFFLVASMGMMGIIALFILEEPKKAAQEEALKSVIESGAEYAFHLTWSETRQLLKSPVNLSFLFFFFLHDFAVGGVSFYLIPFLRNDYQLTALTATFFLVVVSLPQVGGTVFWGRIADKLYLKRPDGKVITLIVTIATGPIFLMIAYGLLPEWRQFGMLAAGAIIGSFIIAATSALAYSVLGDVNPPELRASTFSLMNFTGVLGRSAGILAVGALYNALGGVYHWGFFIMQFFYIGLVTCLIIPKFRVPKELQNLESLLSKRAYILETKTP